MSKARTRVWYAWGAAAGSERRKAVPSPARVLLKLPPKETIVMKYGLAWLIGIPPVLIAAWFLFNHC